MTNIRWQIKRLLVALKYLEIEDSFEPNTAELEGISDELSDISDDLRTEIVKINIREAKNAA
jgi:hypothetical protein